MRTKTLILTAALGLAGVATSMAQTTNVYSLNIVGYVNVTVKPGFNMIANQLNTTNNTLKSLIPVAPDGVQVYKYTPGSGYAAYGYDELAPGWLPNGDITLNPGEGVFIKNNQSTNLTLTFVGEVMVGTTTNALNAGFSIRSSIIPQAGTATQLGIPHQDGDQIYKYVNGSGYVAFGYDDLAPGWLPSEPSFAVGESFFIKEQAAKNWTRTFTVN